MIIKMVMTYWFYGMLVFTLSLQAMTTSRLSSLKQFSHKIKYSIKKPIENSIEKFIITKNNFKKDMFQLEDTWSERIKSFIFGRQSHEVNNMFNYVQRQLDDLITKNDFTKNDIDTFINEIKSNYPTVLGETKQGITIVGYILSELYAYLNLLSYTPGDKKSFNLFLFLVVLADNNIEIEITKIITHLSVLFKTLKHEGFTLNTQDKKIFTKILQKIDTILLQKNTYFSKKKQLNLSLMNPIGDIWYLATIYSNLTGIDLPLLKPQTKSLMDKLNVTINSCPLDFINEYNEKKQNIQNEKILKEFIENYNKLIHAVGFTPSYEYALRTPFLNEAEIRVLRRDSEGPLSRIQNYKKHLQKKDNTLYQKMKKQIKSLGQYE